MPRFLQESIRELSASDLMSDVDIQAYSGSALDHPGIVPVHEAGEHNGQHFLSAFMSPEQVNGKESMASRSVSINPVSSPDSALPASLTAIRA